MLSKAFGASEGLLPACCRWNDPDMLEVGNNGLTLNEQRAHFALWALLKSPLIASADLRPISKEALTILLADEVIAVNQDDLGVAGDLIWKQGPLEVRQAAGQAGVTVKQPACLLSAAVQTCTGCCTIAGNVGLRGEATVTRKWSDREAGGRFAGPADSMPAAGLAGGLLQNQRPLQVRACHCRPALVTMAMHSHCSQESCRTRQGKRPENSSGMG